MIMIHDHERSVCSYPDNSTHGKHSYSYVPQSTSDVRALARGSYTEVIQVSGPYVPFMVPLKALSETSSSRLSGRGFSHPSSKLLGKDSHVSAVVMCLPCCDKLNCQI